MWWASATATRWLATATTGATCPVVMHAFAALAPTLNSHMSSTRAAHRRSCWRWRNMVVAGSRLADPVCKPVPHRHLSSIKVTEICPWMARCVVHRVPGPKPPAHLRTRENAGWPVSPPGDGTCAPRMPASQGSELQVWVEARVEAVRFLDSLKQTEEAAVDSLQYDLRNRPPPGGPSHPVESRRHESFLHRLRGTPETARRRCSCLLPTAFG